MPHRRQSDIPIKVGAGGWNGKFTVEKPVLKEGYVLASQFNANEAEKLARHDVKDNCFAPSAPPAADIPSAASKEFVHQIQVEGSRDQLDTNGSDFHARASHTEVLPTKWDGTFAPGGGPARVKPSQNTNTNNFYGYNTEPTILPAEWDGKFPDGYGAYRPKPSQHTNTNNFYGYSSEPTILPIQWDGKFVQGSEVRMKPETNQSSTNDFYGYSNEPTILPTQWSGKFQLDPNDVRLKPERNQSDVRDYADHRKFHEVKRE